MDFDAYLISKKIDSAEFLKAEPNLWKSWQSEFEQMHPNSFTAQKLYLINPIRRKYQLKQEVVKAPSVVEDQPVEKQKQSPSSDAAASTTPANPKPVVPRPVFKPKPKMS